MSSNKQRAIVSQQTAAGPFRFLQCVRIYRPRSTALPARKDAMKSLVALVALTAAFAGPAFANADLAQKKNCLACHAVDKKVVGPAYKEVAAKYASDKGAAAKLTEKVMKGGVGAWGQIPMPANPQVTEAEAKTLVAWILSQK
jgi:cytochrome c